ncbi:MAG: DUF3299 domain-containing protein [Spirochaetales bacterium]|nr:DUF3299 domain-containing protein [Spirochaetales bacterium]
MKKILIIFLTVWIISSCSVNKDNNNETLTAKLSTQQEEAPSVSDESEKDVQTEGVEPEESDQPALTSPVQSDDADSIARQIEVIMNTMYTRDTESQEIVDGYRSITWWDLISDEEFLYYKRTNDAYDLDFNYYPETDPPPAEVNPEINGVKVRIPGYIVGVDTVKDDFSKVNSFLFVPYQGACIHVPPPPPNQTIFVDVDTPVSSDPYMGYWLYGTIHIETGSNDLASFSYTFKGEKLDYFM